MRKRKTLIYFSLFLFLGLLLPMQVVGQTSFTVTVNEQVVTDNGDDLGLDVYFTWQDGDGKAVIPPSFATVLLEDGTRTPAEIEKRPFYVAVVLDASGSMAEVFEESRREALALVEAAPSEVVFAVIRFEEQIDVVQPFTEDRELVTAAINQVEPENKGTCLYDAAYSAILSLNQIAPNNPRRAISIFTDGRDQLSRSSNAPCSRRTFQQAQTFAAAEDLPIFTIGITGDRNAPTIVALTDLAENASSFTVDDTAESPDAIINLVNSQWVAHANLRPTSGPQRGLLLFTFALGDPLPPQLLEFNSPRDYTNPPAAIDIANFRYYSDTDAFQFDVLLTYFPADHVLYVETVDSDNNTQMMPTIRKPNSEFSQRIVLPTDELIPGRWYTTRVSAHDNVTGGFIKNKQGEKIEATYEFRYDPPRPLLFTITTVEVVDEPAKFNLQQFRLEDDQPELVVALRLENADAVAEYNGRFIDLNNNQVSDTFPIDVTRTGITATARIPIPATFDEAAYTLILNALNEDGEQLATANDQFNYTSPDGVIIRAAKAVRANPILWLAFLLLLGAVTLLSWWVGRTIGRRQAKPAATPVIAEPVADTRQPAILTMVSSPDATLTEVGRWEIKQLPFTIGREACDLTIAGDQHVSRNHARISFADDDYFIEDLGSSNGTFINTTQIAARRPFSLKERGDRIRIGKTTTLVFGELTAELRNELENNNGSNQDH